MIDAIWSDMDLRYPPAVERLSRRATTTIASANRQRQSIVPPFAGPDTGMVPAARDRARHEHDGRRALDGHGPVFIRQYVRMLVRHLRPDEAGLLASLRDARISIARDACPVCRDPHPSGVTLIRVPPLARCGGKVVYILNR
jgi:hypothetical protein